MARRILIVEEDASVLKSISRYLRLLGFEVSEARTAGEGIAMLCQHEIMVIDLNLSDGSAAVVLQRIHDENRRVRTAIWTTTPELAAVGKFAALKPDAVFHKMEINELLAWIGTAERF